jgi:hypothetical protein
MMADAPESSENMDSPETKAGLFSTPLSTPGTRFGLWLGLIVLFIPLAVYFLCLCPTVFVGDAGDFITAAYTWGVPHPPGYPIYTVLGHLFMDLPIPGGISSPAYRMNMMSAICAWAACVFMFLYLRRILRTEWAALAGALALGFSGQFWQHAEIAEVYTMEIMFLTLIFYLAVLYVQTKRLGWALFLSFIMGLALAHHYVVLIFYPGVLIFVGINGGLRFKWYIWLLAIYLALMGLTPYAYLPLVHYKTPLGPVQFVASDQEAESLPKDIVAARETPLQYFLYYVSRKFYSLGRAYTQPVLPEHTTTPIVFRRFMEVTVEDFGIPLLLFGLLGWLAIFISIKNRRKPETVPEGAPVIPRGSLLMPVLGGFIYFLIVHFYPSGDILNAPMENVAVVIPPLLIPMMTSLAAIIALGFDFALRWIAGYVKGQGIDDLAASSKFRTFAALLAIAAFALIGANAYKNMAQGDKSNAVISYDYTLNVLDSCDPGAILLTTGDETFLFWYVQSCEPSKDPKDPKPGYRKDVWATNWIHNLTGLEQLKDEPEAMRRVMENFIINSGYYGTELSNYFGPRPINTTFVASTFADSQIIMAQDVILNGITYLFRRPGDIPPPGTTGFFPRADIGSIVEGAAPLMVIDYFDSRPFDKYRYDGLPGFEGNSVDMKSIDTAIYHHVELEPQEMEVLGRYQDSLYRFGVLDLLIGTPQSYEDASVYLFKCVSLDPAGWFGWKELGDAFLNLGRLDSAMGAYEEVVKLSSAKGDVPPNAESGARAGLANVTLIKHDFVTAEEQARAALLLEPDNHLASAVLQEIAKAKASGLTQQPPPSAEQPGSGNNGSTSSGESGLHGFN